jgi:hypothetical protein
MALQTNPSSWIAWALSWKNFIKYGLTKTQFDDLALQASGRALAIVLSKLNVPQSVLDNSIAGDTIEIAFQQLTAAEFLRTYIGAYANTVAFEEIETAEDQRVKQSNEDLDRWFKLGDRLRVQAENTFKQYASDYKPPEAEVLPYNWY